MERAIKAFADTSNGGMIVTASLVAVVHRDLIITLAPSTACLRSTRTVFL